MMIQGIKWVISLGVDIIAMSLGFDLPQGHIQVRVGKEIFSRAPISKLQGRESIELRNALSCKNEVEIQLS